MRQGLQATLFVANIALVGAWVVLAEGESIQPDSGQGLGSALGIVAWWSAPALVLFLHRSLAGTVVTGVALLAASAVALVSIYASTHSTAAIGFYALPVVGWLLVVGLLAAEWILLRPWGAEPVSHRSP
jgi:hypothetical protein